MMLLLSDTEIELAYTFVTVTGDEPVPDSTEELWGYPIVPITYHMIAQVGGNVNREILKVRLTSSRR